MSTVIPFPKPVKNEPEFERHLFSLHVYGNGVTTTLYAEQDNDIGSLINGVERALMFLHAHAHEQDSRLENDLLFMTCVFSSGTVHTRWQAEGEKFDTPERVAWLDRRLLDIREQLTEGANE